MINCCPKCSGEVPVADGICQQCGSVVLRRASWTPSTTTPPTATPLRRSTIPALSGTWLKVEGAHPSGSFKERVMDVLVREGIENGAQGAVVASSGNAAVAAASQCARTGLPLIVLVPRTVPESILYMLALRGATVMQVGEGPAAVHGIAKRLSQYFALVNLASTFRASGCEWACRGIGVEIAEQLNGAPVDVIAASVSVGPVLIGTANGISQATGRMPRLVAGQASGCSPIARAFALGDDLVTEWTDPVETKATSIADRLTGYEAEGTYLLRQVRSGSGYIGVADDSRLRELRALLAERDGLDVELSSCAAVASLIDSGMAGPNAVCVLTGSGMKETFTTQISQGQGSLSQFLDAVGGTDEDRKEVESWITE